MEKLSEKKDMKRFVKKNWLNFVFIAPLVLFVFSFTIIPIGKTLALGFKDQITNAWTFENYRYVFERGVFSEAVVNTLVISAMGLVFQMTVGFLLASMLRKNFIGKGLARTLVMLPMGIPTMVSGVAMLYLFSLSGYINEVLYRVHAISIPIDWTATKVRSMCVVAVADSWKVMPMVVMLFLSGLESIPRELYEAANVDGAGAFNKFRYITLPQLKATVTMTVLTRLVDLLRIFELPKVLLGASTPFLGTLAYEEYSYGNNSYSAVVSTVLLAIILLVVTAYMFVFEREKKVVRR